MKTLGLIGGTSWHSTLEYYKAINKNVGKIIGTSSNPELILHSINIEVMRAQIIDDINAKYLDVSQKLQKSGAEAIMICANTPHMAVEYVQPKIEIPFLHIGEATGKAAKSKSLKKLALIGNKPTMTKDFLKTYLSEEYNLNIVIPGAADVEESHYFVSKELTQGKFTDEARNFYKQLIQKLRKKNIDGVILGCTELPILLKNINLGLPFLATTDLHIEMGVDFILDRMKN